MALVSEQLQPRRHLQARFFRKWDGSSGGGAPATVGRDDIRALRREGTVGDVLTGELIGRSVGAEKKLVNLMRGWKIRSTSIMWMIWIC